MKILIHMDIDSFFASAAATINPSLINKPIAISSGKARDVVSSVSYQARKYGIHAGMPVFKVIKLCPKIKFIDSNFQLYYYLSNKIFNYLSSNKEIIMEISSIDECFLDVSKIINTWSEAVELAKIWQYNIYKMTKLTVSFGISFNKFSAKMATRLEKPNGISLIDKNNFQDKIWKLDIIEFYGIGKNTMQKLKMIKINIIQDLALREYDDLELKRIFGKNINRYIDLANGIGVTKLITQIAMPKSISKSETFIDGPVLNKDFILLKILMFSKQISAYLKEKGLFALNISINITYGKNMESKSVFSKQEKLKIPINEYKKIYENAMKLFNDGWNPTYVRYIKVCAGSLINKYNAVIQQNIYDLDDIDSRNKIEYIIDKVNYKFKKRVVKLCIE